MAITWRARWTSIAYGVALLVLGCAFVAGRVWTDRLVGEFDSTDHARDVLAEIEGCLSAVVDAETGGRGFALTGEDQ